MRSFSQVHDDEGDCGGQGGSEPLQIRVWVFVEVELEDCGYDDAGEAGEEVAKDEGAGLCKGGVDGVVAEDC